MGVLLECLASLGYVSKKNGRYGNTPMASKWMARSSPSSIADGFRFWQITYFQLWTDLEESIRTGKPQTEFYQCWKDTPTLSRPFRDS